MRNFIWPNLVVEFGLYLFLSMRNKAKKKVKKTKHMGKIIVAIV